MARLIISFGEEQSKHPGDFFESKSKRIAFTLTCGTLEWLRVLAEDDNIDGDWARGGY
jgi:hypothetical protein